MTLSEKDFRYIMHPFTMYDSDKRNIPIVKGSGALLYDENGKSYIDANSSWWVNLHGHSHPYINQKIKEQLDQLEHVIFAGITHEPAILLAEELLQVLPQNQSKVFYSDNGSTAVEVALKLSIQYFENTGRKRNSFIAFKNSYHGDTFGAMSVSERDVFVKPFVNQLFSVDYIDLPSAENFEKVKIDLEKILERKQSAAFIFEPLIQGAGGMRMYDANHLSELIDICQKNEVLCIADEVMTGFGRSGTLFASEQLQSKPDLMCLSKGLTGGYMPLGVTTATKQIFEVFEKNDASKTFYHGHSFTGNPLSCAAARASLELLMKDESKKSRIQIENAHQAYVEKLKENPFFKDIRAKGNILAADFISKDDGYFYTNPVKEKLYRYFIENGILMRPLGNVVYFLPPYCIQDSEMKQVYDFWFQISDQVINL